MKVAALVFSVFYFSVSTIRFILFPIIRGQATFVAGASWGQVGNQNIGNYMYLAPMSYGSYYYNFGNQLGSDADQTVTVPLKAGEHRILLWNGGAQSMFMNSLHFDAGATGIGSLTPALSQGEGAWYTLDGRKVVKGALLKGIYIYNGKKIIIK